MRKRAIGSRGFSMHVHEETFVGWLCEMSEERRWSLLYEICRRIGEMNRGRRPAEWRFGPAHAARR